LKQVFTIKPNYHVVSLWPKTKHFKPINKPLSTHQLSAFSTLYAQAWPANPI
jgi:hypothetical protein